jgi:hypothetical protein
VSLGEDLERVAVAARAHAEPGEELASVIPTEPMEGERVYLCAFAGAGDLQSWLALSAAGEPISERRLVRDAVAIAALCEAAEEAVSPDLARAHEATPRLATPAYLDQLGVAAREREQVNGQVSDSAFAQTMRAATTAAEELGRDVEGGYKVPLR